MPIERRINVRVEDQFFKDVTSKAGKSGTTLQALLVDFLEKWLAGAGASVAPATGKAGVIYPILETSELTPNEMKLMMKLLHMIKARENKQLPIIKMMLQDYEAPKADARPAEEPPKKKSGQR